MSNDYAKLGRMAYWSTRALLEIRKQAAWAFAHWQRRGAIEDGSGQYHWPEISRYFDLMFVEEMIEDSNSLDPYLDDYSI